ncbi:hypothetical protein E4T49_02360 [Aureobasidium sp. EXF-10728]|nr:hypothetical protein E4T49_02360 [Aureobasidium sp. EXF-10728]
MTSEEAPEYTSELNILSPVSPKPVHYPVPSNIPVLENQIDPVFNQTGTHMVEALPQQLPPPMYLNQQAGAYTQNPYQQQQHAQHEQSQSNHPEAYMTQQAGQVGLGQSQPPSQAQHQGHQAYHQAQEQASIGTDSQTNQVPPVVDYDEKYSYQPAASGAVASNDASASASASVPSDLPYPSTAAHHLPALSNQSNNQASFQSNSFQPQSQANSSSANTGASEHPPGVEANSLQSLLNNLSHPSHSQAHSTSPSSQVAQPPSSAANQTQTYSTYTNNSQAQQPQQQQANGGHANSNVRVGANGLPPPPVASFQQGIKLESQRERKQAAGEVLDEDDQPWTPETQHRYDNFLTEERKYVTEGNWEQFPYGSRLFVGNLSSERVTKRDIFHVFHKYGDLAQISIKQAYGFVQFLESAGCSKAISAEQGKTIRGKKIHLEVSKPQKNRNPDPRAPRRSRSPDTGRAGSSSVIPDRYLPGDRRAERDRDRNRDRRSRDYRPGRSPSPRSPRSPRSYRGRDRSRDRYDARYRSRSRTPPYGGRGGRFRSPSPPRLSRRNSDDDLPLPRRAPRDVPDVQIIVLDDLDRNFIAWLEHSFTLQGIRVDVLLLSPRLSEAAVVRRQILEGVLAVSRITRINQQTAKIPLQIFDRRAGIENVRFDEYDNLDPTIAAQLVLRAKAAPAYAPPQPVPAPVQYGYGAGVTAAAPNLSNLITSLDPTGLQKLLGVMQPPGIPTGPHPGLSATALTPDLAKLLGSAAAVRPPPPPLPSPGIPTPGLQSPPSYAQLPHPHQDPLAALRNNPALANLLAAQQQQQQSPQNIAVPHLGVQTPDLRSPIQPQRHNALPSPGQPDMADILAKLGSYRR